MANRRPPHPLALLLGALLAGIVSPALAQRLDPEFQVNQWTTYSQGEPSVSADAAGEFVVAWQSYKQGNDGCYGPVYTGCFSVYARRYDRRGRPLGAEFQVNAATNTTQNSPAVSRRATGEFVVAWDTDVFYLAPGSVRARRFDADGNPISGDLTANTHFGVDQFDAAVGTNSTGEFVVVWEQTDLFDSAIYARRYDSSGTPIGSDFQVQAPTSVTCTGASVAVADSGEFVVVWQLSGAIWAQRYDDAGATLGSAFSVTQGGSTLQAALARRSDGGFVVAWNRNTAGTHDILARSFDAAGVPLGNQFKVDATPAGLESRPAIAVDADGDLLVAWQAPDDDGSGDGVFARRLDAFGTPLSGVFLVNSYTTGDQRYPAAGATPGGDFLVTWESAGQDGNGTGVFARVVRFPFFDDGFESGDTSNWSSTMG